MTTLNAKFQVLVIKPTAKLNQRTKFKAGTVLDVFAVLDNGDYLVAPYGQQKYPSVISPDTVENTMSNGNIDKIARDNTAFNSFDALLDATGPHYSPSMDVRLSYMAWLADEFDAYKELAGEDTRAYRYGA